MIKVLFGSCRAERLAGVIAEFAKILPEVPLVVVSEFQPEGCEWIPYNFRRGVRENLALCRARLAGRRVRLAAVALDPGQPHGPLRAMGFLIAPTRMLVFNEHLSHFAAHPRNAMAIARHVRWRLREFVTRNTHPGGKLYTWAWRLRHPEALRRPAYYRAALAAGALVARAKRSAGVSELAISSQPLADGISVVIPSRDGLTMLNECLPPLAAQLEAGEIIVVDNGSSDGTADAVRSLPNVVVEHSSAPLSFARAANRGILRARFRHVCLLNNDMIVEPGFLAALRDAFGAVPDLFCATAQIFMPAGQRREETGKAIMLPRPKATEFPVACAEPVEGENHSYVLYGSGGASLYDTAKLRALGGFAEVFEPAYVEDLDAGFNAWRMGWPTVFVEAARVLHKHRSTTSRYYTDRELSVVLERNYLRFLARSITDADLFRDLWRKALWRVTVDATERPEMVEVLGDAMRVRSWMEPRPAARMPEQAILAIGSGTVSVFNGRAASQRPRVMVVSPYVPFPLSHGGAVRIYNLMRRAAADFDQILVCFVDRLATPPSELRELCCEIVYVERHLTHALPESTRPDMVEEFDSPVFRAVLRQTCKKWSPAIAQLEFTHMAQYEADCRPAKTILVEHDVTLDLYTQLLAQRDDYETRRQHERWNRFERAAWTQFDRVVTMSEKDRRTVDRVNARTLANGVDIGRFCPAPDEPEPGRLLFIGSFAHYPNLLALDFFLREAWPQLEATGHTLHVIAGSRPEYFLDFYRQRLQVDVKRPGVELEGFVSDVRTAYHRASVVIAPLVASAGTNIKIMEAMAMGKAIVSTPAGVNGLDELAAGRDVIVVSSGHDMAREVDALTRDPARRRELEHHARLAAASLYDWDVIAKRQHELYNELLKQPVIIG